MTTPEKTMVDVTSPLYLHLGENNLIVTDKLQGTSNYRMWKRSMEVSLAARRKIGFVTGQVKRDPDDSRKQEMWEICNSAVISWLHGAVNESIKNSVIYFTTTREIWVHLEKRFTVSNGASKYRLSKAPYEIKQNGSPLNEYYTKLCCVWQELQNLLVFLPISQVTPEVSAYMDAVNQHREEQKLFQFLNGLDEVYGPLRSQLLLQTPLLSAEEACSSLMQEEAQRENLKINNVNEENSAMNAKLEKNNSDDRNRNETNEGCKVCGKKNHTADSCWQVVGYPKGHALAKGNPRSGKKEYGDQRWNKPRQGQYKGSSGGGRMMANAATTEEDYNSGGALTPYQVEQLLKLLPSSSGATKGTPDEEDELDTPFSGLSFRDN